MFVFYINVFGSTHIFKCWILLSNLNILAFSITAKLQTTKTRATKSERGLMLRLYEYLWCVEKVILFGGVVIVFLCTSHILLLLCFVSLPLIVFLSYCGFLLNLQGNILSGKRSLHTHKGGQ